MSKYGIPIGLALLALAGGVVSQSAQAQTVVFSDNFNNSNGSTALGGDTTTQSGSAAPLSYATFTTATADTVSGGTVVTGNGDAGFSPNYNFANAGTNPLAISFDFSFTGSFSRWISFSLGSQTEITSSASYANYYNNLTGGQNGLIIVMNSQGAPNAAISVDNNGATRQTTSLAWSPNLNDAYHVAMTYDPTTFAYTYTLTDATTPITPITASGVIANTTAGIDYMNIGTHNQINTTVDNFLVTAAPEPSEVTSMLAGFLCLGGFALWGARRRNRVS